MSGHSKWHQIRRQKEKVDHRRGKLWSRLAHHIIVAARQGGGDPKGNHKLAFAIEEAKAGNMPAGNIDRAIKRGTGEIEGVDPEELLYEGYGPGGVALVVEALTDNRNRTASQIKHCFDKNGGNLGSLGCVMHLFERKGIILVAGERATEEQLFEFAVEAGAEDIRLGDGMFEISTPPVEFEHVKKALAAHEIPFESAELVYLPHATAAVEEEDARKLLKLIDALEELDDVQHVHGNQELPESLVQELSS